MLEILTFDTRSKEVFMCSINIGVKNTNATVTSVLSKIAVSLTVFLRYLYVPVLASY